MQEILKDPSLREKKIVVRQFPIGTGEYRTMFKELHKLSIRNVIVDVPREHIYQVLKHAQQVDMLSDYHNYFFTSLDVHTVDLEEFQYGGTNISGFSLVDTASKDFNAIVTKIQSETSSNVRYNWNNGENDNLNNIYRAVSSQNFTVSQGSSIGIISELFLCETRRKWLWFTMLSACSPKQCTNWMYKTLCPTSKRLTFRVIRKSHGGTDRSSPIICAT